MEGKIHVIEENNTWELIDRPKNHKVIGDKWIYKTS